MIQKLEMIVAESYQSYVGLIKEEEDRESPCKRTPGNSENSWKKNPSKKN